MFQTYKQTLAFQHLWDSAEKLRKATSAPTQADLSELHIPLLNIAPEGILQKEIKDILDELNMMIHFVKQQKTMLEKFKKNASEIMDVEVENESERLTAILEGAEGAATPPNADRKKILEKKQNLKWFERSAKELLSEIDNHLEELNNLRESATSTSQSVCFAPKPLSVSGDNSNNAHSSSWTNFSHSNNNKRVSSRPGNPSDMGRKQLSRGEPS